MATFFSWPKTRKKIPSCKGEDHTKDRHSDSTLVPYVRRMISN
uniref:Uncharacterized protein n=1 Tax=Anguilla anguilla TaxID=7936 RepID=A0A0E9PEC0_ANGAN